jgi:hypothetical protein
LHLGRWQETLSALPDASVRLILTSPPYDNARTYEGTNEPVDFAELAAFGLRVLMPGGTFAMVLDGAVNGQRCRGGGFYKCSPMVEGAHRGRMLGAFEKIMSRFLYL